MYQVQINNVKRLYFIGLYTTKAVSSTPV